MILWNLQHKILCRRLLIKVMVIMIIIHVFAIQMYKSHCCNWCDLIHGIDVDFKHFDNSSKPFMLINLISFMFIDCKKRNIPEVLRKNGKDYCFQSLLKSDVRILDTHYLYTRVFFVHFVLDTRKIGSALVWLSM